MIPASAGLKERELNKSFLQTKNSFPAVLTQNELFAIFVKQDYDNLEEYLDWGGHYQMIKNISQRFPANSPRYGLIIDAGMILTSDFSPLSWNYESLVFLAEIRNDIFDTCVPTFPINDHHTLDGNFKPKLFAGRKIKPVYLPSVKFRRENESALMIKRMEYDFIVNHPLKISRLNVSGERHYTSYDLARFFLANVFPESSPRLKSLLAGKTHAKKYQILVSPSGSGTCGGNGSPKIGLKNVNDAPGTNTPRPTTPTKNTNGSVFSLSPTLPIPSTAPAPAVPFGLPTVGTYGENSSLLVKQVGLLDSIYRSNSSSVTGRGVLLKFAGLIEEFLASIKSGKVTDSEKTSLREKIFSWKIADHINISKLLANELYSCLNMEPTQQCEFIMEERIRVKSVCCLNDLILTLEGNSGFLSLSQFRRDSVTNLVGGMKGNQMRVDLRYESGLKVIGQPLKYKQVIISSYGYLLQVQKRCECFTPDLQPRRFHYGSLSPTHLSGAPDGKETLVEFRDSVEINFEGEFMYGPVVVGKNAPGYYFYHNLWTGENGPIKNFPPTFSIIAISEEGLVLVATKQESYILMSLNKNRAVIEKISSQIFSLPAPYKILGIRSSPFHENNSNGRNSEDGSSWGIYYQPELTYSYSAPDNLWNEWLLPQKGAQRGTSLFYLEFNIPRMTSISQGSLVR